jgi:ABC-type taurine transport system ATPase subunit
VIGGLLRPSTMLRAMSGLDTPPHGRVVPAGTVISSPHQQIGIIFGSRAARGCGSPTTWAWLETARRTSGANGGGALDRVGLADSERSGRANYPAARHSASPSARAVRAAAGAAARRAVLALDAFTRADLQEHLLGGRHPSRR